ncbi:MAG: UdgX family uracil-DNA binding protein [Shimia sp.]
MSYTVTLPRIGTAGAWRAAARAGASNGIAPEAIDWRFEGDPAGLFEGAPLPAPTSALTVPKAFVQLADGAVWHADPARFALLYEGLLRIQRTPALLRDPGDAGMAKLRGMQKNVARCIHKLHAFVRFRELPSDDRPRFAAWFEPTHHSIEPGTPFFARRFGDMDWMIATPDVTARFEGGKLSFHPGQPKPDLPDDAHEDLWTQYYRSIFNPARVKVSAMCSEMPRKYWKNMPETRIIPELLASAEGRVREMQEAAPTLPPLYARRIAERRAPPRVSEPMADLFTEQLTREDLIIRAEAVPAEDGYGRMVLGTGPMPAPLMVVGEQPGDVEDREGRPFVGPAGQMFDRAAQTAGLKRDNAYVTNAVKRFKYVQRGKRRLHQSPDRDDIAHGRWWLEMEEQLVKPKLILSLGGTAAEVLTGDRKGLLKRRGQVEEGRFGPTFLTVHPAYILRLPSPEQKAEEEARFTEDLAKAHALLIG